MSCNSSSIKFLLACILVCVSVACEKIGWYSSDQEEIELNLRQSENTYQLSLINTTRLPYTVILTLSNVQVDILSDPSGKPLTLQPLSESPVVTFSEYPHSTKTSLRQIMGSLLEEATVEAMLPCECGVPCPVSQASELRTHEIWDQYAVDFDLHEGTPVYAITPGEVVQVQDASDKNCSEKSLECNRHTNMIRTLSPEGVVTEYLHLQKDSAVVTVGDKISAGDLLASSGNTGFSTAPHLHVASLRVSEDYEQVTLPLQFMAEDGLVTLKTGDAYTRTCAGN